MTQDANQTEQPADQEQSPCSHAGPWVYVDSGQMVLTSDGDIAVADVRGWGTLSRRYGEQEAARVMDQTGRLIAAAPEMLEALQEANKFLADLAKRGGVKDGPEGLNDWCRVQSKVSDAIRATVVV